MKQKKNILRAALWLLLVIAAPEVRAQQLITANGDGTYTITMPDHNVTVTADVKKLLTHKDIKVSIPSQEWTGSELTPVITVTDGENTLALTTDYTVTAPSGPVKDAGDYTYTITGMGSYTGETTATFTITASISVEYTITDVSGTDTRGKLDFYSDPTCSTATAAAAEGATVYIKVTTNGDYQLSSITAQCAAPCDGADSRRSESLPIDETVAVKLVAGTTDVYELTMPNCNVEVKATWEHVPVILAIGNGGWATYYHEDGVTYSVSDGTAYYVSSIGDGVVNLKAIDGVPAGLPVLISGTAGQSVTLTETAAEVEVTDNVPQFKGTATDIPAADFTDFVFGRTYVLYGGRFMLVETNGGIGAHKCWLTLSGSSASRSLKINLGETSLSPNPIPADAPTRSLSPEGKGSSCAWYDLQGRKIVHGTSAKGVYIYKGKKVIIK